MLLVPCNMYTFLQSIVLSQWKAGINIACGTVMMAAVHVINYVHGQRQMYASLEFPEYELLFTV